MRHWASAASACAGATAVDTASPSASVGTPWLPHARPRRSAPTNLAAQLGDQSVVVSVKDTVRRRVLGELTQAAAPSNRTQQPHGSPKGDFELA